jgi:hypothetical protein
MQTSKSLWLCLFLAILPPKVPADVHLIAKAAIPGDAADLSGLDGKLEDGIPRNRLGGIGSGIAYTGKGNLYILVSDRGPGDGTTNYLCRFHTMKITLVDGALQTSLQSTTLLCDESGRPLTGHLAALAPDKKLGGRFDPEGVRIGPDGTIYICDEYGPFIDAFDRQGKRIKRLPIPSHFQLQLPSADPAVESQHNAVGRYPNKGMEGLALTPDGRKLVGIMQSPLIQDGGRTGVCVRILQLDLATEKTAEFLYLLDDKANGVSEILAINQHEFLVLERDSKPGPHPFRKVFKIDLAKATKIQHLSRLPATGASEKVTPVSKQLFLDLHDPRFGLKAGEMPFKVEGLAFGPDLPDGRHLLLVATDNDFEAKQPTRFFAFAIDRSDLALAP